MTPLPRSAGGAPAFVPAVGSPYDSGNTGEVRADAVTFSPDGRLLVLRTRRTQSEIYWGEGSLSVFEVGEGGALGGQRELVPDEPLAVAFSPDGKLLAAAYRDSPGAMASLFSVGPDGMVSAVDGSPFATGGDYAGPIVFSPDGRLLAAANGSQGLSVSQGPGVAAVSVFSIGADVRLTEVAGSPIPNGPPFDKTPAPAFSPDGQLLAIADKPPKVGRKRRERSTVSVFEVGPDGALTIVSDVRFGKGRELGSPAFSPDGTLLAVTGSDARTAFVFVFAVESDGALAPVADSLLDTPTAPDWSVRFSPTGKLLAVTGWYFEWMSLLEIGPGGAMSPVAGAPFDTWGPPEFSPDGRRLAVATGAEEVSVMAVGADNSLSPLPGSPFPTGPRPSSLAFSPDGNLLAVANTGAQSVSVLAATPSA